MSNFLDYYEVLKEVMPSTHDWMQVRFGLRRRDGQEVVVKIRLKPGCFRCAEDEQAWRRNTEFLLNMPETCGVARLHEVLEDARAYYIVMEKVKGMDLFEALEVQGRVSVPVAQDIVRQLLLSLAHLHRHNAVHKDLKLENVMVGTESPQASDWPLTPNSVKVIDFDTLEEWTPSSPKSRDVVGTDQYISPEAYAGKYSPLSDVFAAGVIAYRLLSGRFPFSEQTFDDEAGENWVGSPKMEQIRLRLQGAKVDFSQPVFRENREACDLVARMLDDNELLRPSADEALAHPWMQTVQPAQPDQCDDAWRDAMVAQEDRLGDLRRRALLRT